MRAVSIGGVRLTNPMRIRESTTSHQVTGELHETIGGGAVIFERRKDPSRQTLTLESGNYGWQKKEVVDALIFLAEQRLGEEVEVVNEDGTHRICRFAYEAEDGACVSFEPVFEGASIYKGTIYLGVVR